MIKEEVKTEEQAIEFLKNDACENFVFYDRFSTKSVKVNYSKGIFYLEFFDGNMSTGAALKNEAEFRYFLGLNKKIPTVNGVRYE